MIILWYIGKQSQYFEKRLVTQFKIKIKLKILDDNANLSTDQNF